MASTPFYRTESRLGCWTEPPVAPGPFSSAWGECVLFDSRDLDDVTGHTRRRWLGRPPFAGAEYVGASGCDQVLWWPERQRALLVWQLYDSACDAVNRPLTAALARCSKALAQLTADIARFTAARLQLSGLVLIADLAREDAGSEILVQSSREPIGRRVVALRLPPAAEQSPRFGSKLREAVQLALAVSHEPA